MVKAIIYSILNFFRIKTKPTGMVRTLIVDDSPNTLLILKPLLLEENCRLTFVDSGKKAIEELKVNNFDLVVLDNFMQDLTGSETLILADKELHSKSSNTKVRKIPVIVYSSLRNENENMLALNHFRFVAKINKSTGLSNLKNSIEDILEDIRSEVLV